MKTMTPDQADLLAKVLKRKAAEARASGGAVAYDDVMAAALSAAADDEARADLQQAIDAEA